jgi:asparagine N-glycosylation enzyme membrane subunit Stt3
MDSSCNYSKSKKINNNKIVWCALAIVETILALQLILKMVGAGHNNIFTNFIYIVAGHLSYLFLYIFTFAGISIENFDWAVLLTMLAYFLIALGIIKLLSKSRTSNEQKKF